VRRPLLHRIRPARRTRAQEPAKPAAARRAERRVVGSLALAICAPAVEVCRPDRRLGTPSRARARSRARESCVPSTGTFAMRVTARRRAFWDARSRTPASSGRASRVVWARHRPPCRAACPRACVTSPGERLAP
jgi:hypothetical protein